MGIGFTLPFLFSSFFLAWSCLVKCDWFISGIWDWQNTGYQRPRGCGEDGDSRLQRRVQEDCDEVLHRVGGEWTQSACKKLLKELLAVCCHMKINVVHVLLCYLFKFMHWTFYEFHINLFNKRLYSINKNIIKF